MIEYFSSGRCCRGSSGGSGGSGGSGCCGGCGVLSGRANGIILEMFLNALFSLLFHLCDNFSANIKRDVNQTWHLILNSI